MITEYEKKENVTYKAGICFIIQAPYDDTLDCMQVEAGQATADDLVVVFGDQDEGSGLWNNTYAFPMDTISKNSWVTEPVGFVSGVYETDELAVENCDDQNKCTLTFAFGRNFETDKDERSDSRKQLEDILIEAGD